ncbi:uncharacterized protein V1510DRAFT_439558 [Dipodascopsis tothii]|uniref:uncharacterized protein n=1 Tax=Dipodascopsis tothii TaxID=44089 RepID=UPI0034D0083B
MDSTNLPAGPARALDAYTGNTTLYRFMHTYRQPVFLERNLDYLFADAGKYQLRTTSTAAAGGSARSRRGGRALAAAAVGAATGEVRRKRRRRKPVRVDDVCERLAASAGGASAPAAAEGAVLAPALSQPVLRIELKGLVRLQRPFRNSRSSHDSLRPTTCRAELQLYRRPGGRKARAPVLLYKCSNVCTLLPTAADSRPATPGGDSDALVAMDEPFYLKLSDFLQDSDYNEFRVGESADEYALVFVLRRSGRHLSWPFRPEPTSVTASPMSRTSPMGASPGLARLGSPISPLALQKMRHSPRRKGRTKHRPKPKTPTTEAGATPAPDTVYDLRGEVELSLADCLRAADSPLPLYLHADGVRHEAEAAQTGLQLDLGWGIPGLQREPVARAPSPRTESPAALAAPAGSAEPAEPAGATSAAEAEAGDDWASSRKPSEEAYVVPRYEADKVEARYHFTVGSDCKTFTLAGFQCPWCNSRNFGTFERLHFHFVTSHELFTFRVELRKRMLMDVYVSLASEYVYERIGARQPDMREFEWCRPFSAKFNLNAFLCGDVSWLQLGSEMLGVVVEGARQPAPRGRKRRGHSHDDGGDGDVSNSDSFDDEYYSAHESSDDELREWRKHKLLMSTQRMYDNPETVPELFPRLKRRTIAPPVEVELYRTKSKRRVFPGEELSESEDDVDETWLLARHNETIDDFEDVSATEKRFIKLWDAHIFDERPASYRLVTDSIFRFCRKHKEELRDRALLTEFWKHCLNLVDSGVIEPICFYTCMKYLRAPDEGALRATVGSDAGATDDDDGGSASDDDGETGAAGEAE